MTYSISIFGGTQPTSLRSQERDNSSFSRLPTALQAHIFRRYLDEASRISLGNTNRYFHQCVRSPYYFQKIWQEIVQDPMMKPFLPKDREAAVRKCSRDGDYGVLLKSVYREMRKMACFVGQGREFDNIERVVDGQVTVERFRKAHRVVFSRGFPAASLVVRHGQGFAGDFPAFWTVRKVTLGLCMLAGFAAFLFYGVWANRKTSSIWTTAVFAGLGGLCSTAFLILGGAACTVARANSHAAMREKFLAAFKKS